MSIEAMNQAAVQERAVLLAATSASDAIPSRQMAAPVSPELQAQIEAMVLAAAPSVRHLPSDDTEGGAA